MKNPLEAVSEKFAKMSNKAPEYPNQRHRHPSKIRFWNYEGRKRTTPSYGFGVQKPMAFSILRTKLIEANHFDPISQQSPEQRAAHYQRLAAFRQSVVRPK